MTDSAARQRITIPGPIRDEIIAHAHESSPDEACGLIAGRSRVATRVIQVPNVADDRLRRYQMEGQVVHLAIRSMEGAAEEDADGHIGEPLAIYHSHVHSGAYPSPTDRADARWPSSFYILVSIRAGDPELRGYRILNDHDGSEKTVLEVDIV